MFESAPDDVYYFNAISCYSDSHCVAVAEGEDATSYHAYVTFDGGDTWTDGLVGNIPAGAFSVVAVDMISDSEVWLPVSTKSGRLMSTNFMKSADGGKTYSSGQVIL